MTRLAFVSLLGLIAGAGLGGAEARAQATQPVEELNEQVLSMEPVAACEKQAGGRPGMDLIVAPIPLSNPTLGTGLAGVAVAYYNPNGEPDPWVTGVGAGYTSTGTWGLGAFHKMSLGGDRLRIAGLLGAGDAHVKFYGIGGGAGDKGLSLKLRDKAVMGYLDGQVRIGNSGLFRHLFVGARIAHTRVRSTLAIPTPDKAQIEIPEFELRSHISAIGPSVTYDSRDQPFAPRKGVYVTADWMFGADFLGSDFTHRKLEIKANGFFPLGPRTVLGIRRSLCIVKGEAPYYDLCLFGKDSDLRGYEAGRYRDHASWALQAEIRQQLSTRVGAVWFGGAGGTAASGKDIWKHSHVLPSVGMGLRYLASPENRVNLRMDLAYGRDGAALYFGIGEAF